MEVKIGLQPEIHTVVYTGLEQHWLKWGSEIKVEVLHFPATDKLFYICTDLKDKTKVCTVTSFMFSCKPLDVTVKTTEISWSHPNGFMNKELEKSSKTSFAQTTDKLKEFTEVVRIYCGWTITKGDFSNFNIKCPQNLVTGSYMSLEKAYVGIDSYISKYGNPSNEKH